MEEKRQLLISHSTPGRVRFRCQGKKTKIPNIDKLLKIPGVKEVMCNKVTQSLVILYDKKILSLTRLIAAIREKNPGINVVRGKSEGLDFLVPVSDKGSRFSQEVYEAAKDVDALFRKGTKNKLDIPSLIAAALVLTGLVDLFRRPELPSWDDLMWYGTNMFYWQSKRYNGKEKLERR